MCTFTQKWEFNMLDQLLENSSNTFPDFYIDSWIPQQTVNSKTEMVEIP